MTVEAFPREGQLEDLDRELLNAVQWDFPLEARPYAALGDRLGLDEPALRARVARVKELGVLRQLSAIFDTRALGYGSALVAAKVEFDAALTSAQLVEAIDACEGRVRALDGVGPARIYVEPDIGVPESVTEAVPRRRQ